MTDRATPYTAQEIFDKVARHLHQQGHRSIVDHGALAIPRYRCVYEAPDGTRCAVGCLMPDDDEALECDGDLDSLLDSFPRLASYFGVWRDAKAHGGWGGNYDLLQDLQGAHDDGGNWGPDSFVGVPALQNIADEYGLDRSVLSELWP